MKPILKIKRSTLGTSIVIRSPFSRRWLMNITLAPKRPKCYHHWVKEYDGSEYCLACDEYRHNTTDETDAVFTATMPGFGFLAFVIGLVLFSFVGCADVNGPAALDAKEKMVSTRYISEDSVSLSCWYTSQVTAKDSLIVGKTRYTVSERSRYRLETLSSEYLDVISEGAVNGGDWGIYRDTKTDSIYVFLDCTTRDQLKAERE